MGDIRITEMLAGGIKYDVVLHDHLRHNVYPPMPELVGMADKAIDAVVEDEPDRHVRLPDGGRCTAQQVVEGLHLQPFVDHRREADDDG